MTELRQGSNVNCQWFLNELEGLSAEEAAGVTAEALLLKLPEAAREHSARCAECEAAARDCAETRRALEPMKKNTPEAGPWFSRRVMQAIAAQEEELEERQSGFWISVRRLAPRLVAFATLVLVLGGTWAIQVQRLSGHRGPEVRPAEGIFETLPSTPANDDVIASAYEDQLP
jgi:hypothetical protein